MANCGIESSFSAATMLLIQVNTVYNKSAVWFIIYYTGLLLTAAITKMAVSVRSAANTQGSVCVPAVPLPNKFKSKSGQELLSRNESAVNC